MRRKFMNKLGLALSPIVLAAVVFALSGVAAAQSRQVAGAKCPAPQVAGHKINESEALNLAQQYADNNLKGFKVVQPSRYGGRGDRGAAFTGGYNTVCYSKDGDAFYSVEYSFDAKNSKGSMRTLHVDQFGSVTQYHGIESAATR
jgi:hypothetical protein